MTRAAKVIWIDADSRLNVGDVGFLTEKSHELDHWTRYWLDDTPAYTNQSFMPRLYGWCGTCDNIAMYAHGMARVVRIARNGRILVRELDGDELIAALEELGYPELAPKSDAKP
jgi:hypothetical protein